MADHTEPDPTYREAFTVGQVRFRNRLIELLGMRKATNLEASGWRHIDGKLVPAPDKTHPGT